jgi:HSP20 family molecular chaperone IbpA
MKINNTDDLDDLFKLMDKLMNQQFTGGYKRAPQQFDNYEEEEEDDQFDITEDAKYIYITVELRGLQREDFNVLVEPYSFILEVFIDGNWYSDKFKLPCKVKRKVKIEFNNCILDVILTKEKEKNERKKRGRPNGRTTEEGSHPEVI